MGREINDATLYIRGEDEDNGYGNRLPPELIHPYCRIIKVTQSSYTRSLHDLETFGKSRMKHTRFCRRWCALGVDHVFPYAQA
jgi:hypothetical protein